MSVTTELCVNSLPHKEPGYVGCLPSLHIKTPYLPVIWQVESRVREKVWSTERWKIAMFPSEKLKWLLCSVLIHFVTGSGLAYLWWSLMKYTMSLAFSSFSQTSEVSCFTSNQTLYFIVNSTEQTHCKAAQNQIGATKVCSKQNRTESRGKWKRHCAGKISLFWGLQVCHEEERHLEKEYRNNRKKVAMLTSPLLTLFFSRCCRWKYFQDLNV